MAANTYKAPDGKPAETEGAKAANIPAATGVDTSGASQQIVPDVDMSHPAVDSNPRAGTTVDQNKIDFNDPTLSGAEAVAKNLREQGLAVAEPEVDTKAAK